MSFQDVFWHFQVVAEGLGQVVYQDFFDFGQGFLVCVGELFEVGHAGRCGF